MPIWWYIGSIYSYTSLAALIISILLFARNKEKKWVRLFLVGSAIATVSAAIGGILAEVIWISVDNTDKFTWLYVVYSAPLLVILIPLTRQAALRLFRPEVGRLEAKGDVQGLIKALSYKHNVKVCHAAAIALGKMGDLHIVDHLMQALKNDDRNVRVAMAEGLEQMGPAVIESLVLRLKDEDWRIREGVTLALGNISDAQTVEPLLLAFKDQDGAVWRAASKALVQKGRDAVPRLITALSDKHSDFSRVADVLGQIGDARASGPLARNLTDPDNNVREAAAQALVKIGAPAVSQLISMLKYEPATTVAAQALAQIGTPAVELLITALQDPDVRVRWAAAWTLGEIRDERAVAPLLRAIQDNSVREIVIGALGKLKNARAVPQLLSTLHDSNKEVRKNTAWALGQIGDSRAVEHLIITLKDSDSDVMKYAAEALVNIGMKPLVTALNGTDQDTWKMVAERIGPVGGLGVVQMLVDALPKQSYVVQQTVVDTFTRMGYDILPPGWPAYSVWMIGENVIRINNPTDSAVRVGVRSGNAGQDLRVPPQEIVSTSGPNGFYHIYLQFSTEKLELYQGDSFTLNNRSIQITLKEVRGGNYRIRKVS